MTVGIGDVCLCGDVALPGLELCAGCLADLQARRATLAAEAAKLTTDHEAQVLAADEVAAA